jgi:hypothetical protein
MENSTKGFSCFEMLDVLRRRRDELATIEFESHGIKHPESMSETVEALGK